MKRRTSPRRRALSNGHISEAFFSLLARPSACDDFGKILRTCARRHAQAELQQQLVRDPFRAQDGFSTAILRITVGVQRNPWSTGLAFNARKAGNLCGANEEVWRYDGQGVSPINQRLSTQASSALIVGRRDLVLVSL